MNNDILDDDLLAEPKDVFMLTLTWWEKKRLTFTLLVLATQILSTSFYFAGIDRFGIPNAIFQSILYLLAANLFYCLGWGIEFLLKYYSKGIRLSNKTKWTLFVLGTLFSVFLTWFLYKWSLDYVMIDLTN